MPVLAFRGPTAPAPPSLRIDVAHGCGSLPADTDLFAATGVVKGATLDPDYDTLRAVLETLTVTEATP